MDLVVLLGPFLTENLIDNFLTNFGVRAHKVAVDKVNSKVFQFDTFILFICADCISSQVTYFAERTKEFCRSQIVLLHFSFC